ncbi:MAG: 50S ribosomal protein L24, partial [Methyloprofundus sp.]|nr:50S ribosomal protein L24 [Methyloprofundus sp.]
KVVQLVAGDKVLVEGINRVKKHQKPNPNAGITGGIIDKDMPIHISNVGLYNPESKKADRVGLKFLDDGKKVRYFKSNNEVIDV